MSQAKPFPVEVVVSAIHGVLLCPIDRVYEVLSHLSNGPVWTHELPGVGRIARPHVLRAHPELDVDVSGVDPSNWRVFVEALIRRFPDPIMLEPIPDYGRTAHSVETAMEMLGAERVVGVELDAPDSTDGEHA